MWAELSCFLSSGDGYVGEILESEIPDVSREHLSQLEKIQEILSSRRDEAHFR